MKYNLTIATVCWSIVGFGMLASNDRYNQIPRRYKRIIYVCLLGPATIVTVCIIESVCGIINLKLYARLMRWFMAE